MKIDKIFVINLKRRSDRLIKFFSNCPIDQDKIEVFNGFDAKNLNNESKEDLMLYNSNQLKNLGGLYRIGEKGCFISHFKIWNYIIENNIDNTLIFEDDAFFSDNFLTILKNIKLDEFYIIYLGGRFQKDFIMPDYCQTKIDDNIVEHNISNWNGIYHDRTTHAYVINYKLAELFLKEFLNSENIDLPPVDHFMMNILKKYNIPIFNTNPLMCWSPINGDSDIR